MLLSGSTLWPLLGARLPVRTLTRRLNPRAYLSGGDLRSENAAIAKKTRRGWLDCQKAHFDVSRSY